MAIIALVALAAVVVLALTGHPEAIGPVAFIGGAALTTGGISITVNIRR